MHGRPRERLPGAASAASRILAVSFSIFERSDVREVVERFSDSSRVTVVVGAGASIEAGFPSWQQLIERLLQRAARTRFADAETEDRDLWVRETLSQDGLLGAGAVVEALSREQLQA